MRIVFVNLHGNEMLVKTANKYVFRQSCAIKHKYLLDWLLNKSGYEVCSYINKRGFSLASSLGDRTMNFLNLFRFIEHNIILKKNGIARDKITLLKDASEIRNDDIVILYLWNLYQILDTKAFKALSLIHISGYKKEADNLRSMGIDVMINESNLSHFSKLFNQNYDWYDGDFIITPFVYEPRFQQINPFEQRENRAFSVGTITYKEIPEFIDVYTNSCVQPMRKQIKDHAKELEALIACYNSDYTENVATKKISATDNRVLHFFKALHYKLFASQQKQYYSFNMVERFNNFKMCVVGEEILGVPGIGFVEGMACGCAYIGINNGMYEDYGMVEGKHYIGYDGTLEDLKNKITYYQQNENQEELKRIAHAGYLFAQEHFSKDAVAKKLIENLISAQKATLKETKDED